MRKKESKNFIAILLSGDKERWFSTEEQAWDWIYSISCDSCKANKEFDACSAEWDVWSKAEWFELSHLKLPQHFIDYLVNKPESGMGYHLVDIELENGTIIYNQIVINCEYIKQDKIDLTQIKRLYLI